MPKFIIERDLPDAGKLTAEQLHDVAVKSCDVLRAMGPSIQWVESYVTDHRIYCIYNAESADQVRDHARRGGFPADEINQVRARIDPTTSEGRIPTAAR